MAWKNLIHLWKEKIGSRPYSNGSDNVSAQSQTALKKGPAQILRGAFFLPMF
jgi:hypothetical protein